MDHPMAKGSKKPTRPGDAAHSGSHPLANFSKHDAGHAKARASINANSSVDDTDADEKPAVSLSNRGVHPGLVSRNHGGGTEYAKRHGNKNRGGVKKD